jgi:hypothetical protein
MNAFGGAPFCRMLAVTVNIGSYPSLIVKSGFLLAFWLLRTNVFGISLVVTVFAG